MATYDLTRFLPFLIPVIIIQFGLTIAALVHVLRHDNYRTGNRVLWVVLSFFAFIGPILYFTIGKGDE